MADQKPLFKAPYDLKDVSALFAIVAIVLIIAAIVGNNLFGLFQENVNFAGGRPSRPNQAYFQARALPGPGAWLNIVF